MTAGEMTPLSPIELVAAISRRATKWNQVPGTKGGNPTRQLRFEVRMRHSSIVQSLRARPSVNPAAPVLQRMSLPAQTIHDLTSRHLSNAIGRARATPEDERYGTTTDYLVRTPDGSTFRPKQVIGYALESALDRPVSWREFRGGIDTPAFKRLEDEGFAILKAAPQGDAPEEIEEILEDIGLDDEDEFFVEGSKKRASHLKRERNPAATRKAKRRFIEKHGKLFCEHCRDDLIAGYGAEIAPSCFDAHHAQTQISDMEDGHKTNWKDLQILCANCHRAEHRRMKLQDP